jgi:hypothetical protein
MITIRTSGFHLAGAEIGGVHFDAAIVVRKKFDWRCTRSTLHQDNACTRRGRGTSFVERGPSSTAPKYLSALFHSGTPTRLSDREVLGRFASARGEGDHSAEQAFATLVARHGPMMARVCRAVLGDRQSGADPDCLERDFYMLDRHGEAPPWPRLDSSEMSH